MCLKDGSLKELPDKGGQRMSRKNLLFMQINRKFKKMRGLILSQKCSFNAQGIYSLENVELQNVHPGKRPYSAPSFHK